MTQGPNFDRRLLLSAGVLLAAGCSQAKTQTAPVADATVRTGKAPVAGLDVYYEVHGGDPVATPPFVLLHGGVMAIKTAFAGDLLPKLAKIRPVIAIEQQGHGHTGDRSGPISLERMIDDTAGVLDHLGVKAAHFVGHSLGGMISMGMAIRHPEKVLTTTPISAMYRLEGFLPELVIMQRDPKHMPSPALVPLLPTQADFAAWKAHYDAVNPDPKTFDSVVAKLNAMLATWRGWTNRELAAVKAPTLLIIGDNDFVRIEHAAEMARLIPDAQLAVLPGTMHMNIQTRGAMFIPMIQARAG